MADVLQCTCTDCVHNDGLWHCDKEFIEISDTEMRADGFYPRCKDFEEREIE